MTTYNLAAVPITANVQRDLAWVVIPPIVQEAEVQMTDPTGDQWPLTIDTTRHMKCWGLQIDVPGDPRWWLFEGDANSTTYMKYATDADDKVIAVPIGDPDPTLWLPFGARVKGVAMPRVRFEGSARAAMRIRVSFLSDADVTLGATITTIP